MSTTAAPVAAGLPIISCGMPARDHGQVIIDLESLILDPLPGVRSSLHFTVKALGIAADAQDIDQDAGRVPLPTLLFRWLGDPEAARQALATFHSHYNTEGRFDAAIRLDADHLLATLTDCAWSVHYLTHIGADAAGQMIERFAGNLPLKSVVSSRRPGAGMMRPHLLTSLLQRSATRSSNTLILSDHPLELAAARDLGIPAMALGYGRAPAAVLNQYAPVHIAQSCADAAGALSLYTRTSTLLYAH